MKYKVGDKVVLKDSTTYDSDVRDWLWSLDNSVATIRLVAGNYYYMKNAKWFWREDEIDGIYKKRHNSKKLKADLVKIQTYYDALDVEVERRALPLEEPTLLVRSTVLSAPILQPIDLVVPKPNITLRQLPVNVRSRIFSRPRLRRNR